MCYETVRAVRVENKSITSFPRFCNGTNLSLQSKKTKRFMYFLSIFFSDQWYTYILYRYIIYVYILYFTCSVPMCDASVKKCYSGLSCYCARITITRNNFLRQNRKSVNESFIIIFIIIFTSTLLLYKRRITYLIYYIMHEWV